ncbi:MAG TPA: very short patch repair endonuclease [Planctomycetota bacterium]
MDRLSKAKRSWNMSRIRAKNTSPEVAVRSIIHSLGYRFRLHPRHVFGCPDIVLPRLRTVVLVHGCFWHRHPKCRYTYRPKSNLEFWNRKFQANMKRDEIVRKRLRNDGWRMLVVWECELRKPARVTRRLARLLGTAKTMRRPAQRRMVKRVRA